MKYNLNVGSLVLRRDITEKGTKEWLCKIVATYTACLPDEFTIDTKIKTFGFLKKFVKPAYSCNYWPSGDKSKTYAICINKRLLQEFGFKPSKTRTNLMEYDSKKWRIEIHCEYDTTPENVDKNKFLLRVYSKKRSMVFGKCWCWVKYMHDIQAVLRTVGCDCPKRLVRYIEPDEK